MNTSDITKQLSKPIERIKAWKQERDERPKELALAFGEQDNLDILSYAGLQEQADYLCIDGIYIRTLSITGYPYVASSGWLDNLINFNHDADISYHIEEVDALSALPKLHRKINNAIKQSRAINLLP